MRVSTIISQLQSISDLLYTIQLQSSSDSIKQTTSSVITQIQFIILQTQNITEAEQSQNFSNTTIRSISDQLQILSNTLLNLLSKTTTEQNATLKESIRSAAGRLQFISDKLLETKINKKNPTTENSQLPKKSKLRVKNIVVLSPGDGYLSAPDGSLGGNGRIWKSSNEYHVKTADGRYYVVPDGNPTNLQPGDTFFPPTPPPEPVTYQVVTQIDEVYILDPGFGYETGDTLEVIPNNGAILEPVINQRGEIAKINVINPGIGFIDLPEIIINSPRGYNAKLIPVLKVIPIADIPNLAVIPPGTQLISVVDCVGKIPTSRSFFRAPR